MRFLRLACVTLPKLRESWRNWVLEDGDVRVESHGSTEVDSGIRLIVSGSAPLAEPPDLDHAGRVVVPPGAQRACEQAIESAANLLAVGQGTPRTISSPVPCVALIRESDEDRDWLSRVPGFALPKCEEQTAWFGHDLNVFEHLEVLSDRLDGVSLLAEAISQAHLAGRFRDLIRVFERAFARSSAALVKPLATFLHIPLYGYTEAEVRNWLLDVRHPLTHADKGNAFLIERDVRPILRRVEEAAYEVLLNKRNWRKPDSAREVRWTPDAVLTQDTPVIRRHSTPVIHFYLLDDLCCYGRDLNATMRKPPEEWWIGDYWERAQTT